MATYSCIWGDVTTRSRKVKSPCNWIHCRRRLIQLWADFSIARGDTPKPYRIYNVRLNWSLGVHKHISASVMYTRKWADFRTAIAAYQSIGELAPKGGDSRSEIARVYALMGKPDDARQMINGVNSHAVSGCRCILRARRQGRGIQDSGESS